MLALHMIRGVSLTAASQLVVGGSQSRDAAHSLLYYCQLLGYVDSRKAWTVTRWEGQDVATRTNMMAPGSNADEVDNPAWMKQRRSLK